MQNDNQIDIAELIRTSTIMPGLSRYLICRTGHVWSVAKGFLREVGAVSKGRYKLLCLTKDNGKIMTVWQHRLIWQAFNGRIPKHLQICHIDDNKQNNDLSNLMLGTAKVNCNMGSRNSKISAALKRYWQLKREAMAAAATTTTNPANA